jgi:hypothetical protein
MTTGFERETRTTPADKARSKSYVWGIVLAIIVIALAAWAISSNRPADNVLAPNATSSPVQNSGTGDHQ